MIAPQRQTHHPALHYAAAFLSYLFHPLFVPVYVLAFLVFYTGYFPAYTGEGKVLLLVRFFIMYSVFPLVTVLLAKGLGFVKSIRLEDRKDRIIPYVACGVYYFWMWYVLRNQSEAPAQIVDLSLAIFLASSAGLIANSFLKVSMHGISMGVASAFVLLLGFSSYNNFGPYISIVIFLTGLVCTARLIHSDHSSREVYMGLLIGVAAQLLAFVV